MFSKTLKYFVPIISPLLLTSCLKSSTYICGVEVTEGQALPTSITNQSLHNALSKLDSADEKRKNGQPANVSFSFNGTGNYTLLIAASLNMAGIGTNGQDLILRSAKNWEEASTPQIQSIVCSE